MKRALTLTILTTSLAALPLLAVNSDDARIVSSAKDSYVYRTYLKNDHIKIESKDGVVTLKGTVPDRSYKSMAADTVENLPGVQSVDNRIRVEGEAAPEKSDGWIEFKIKSTLMFHRSVSSGSTKVSVNEGVVTLRGTADSDAQKELTEEYAKDVDGVKEIKNELTVSGSPSTRTLGEKVDDASITAQTKSVLLTHRSTSALKTKVTTRDGVVYLNGDAKNQAEKDLVTKLANDIHGVKNVVNNMTVKE